MELREKKKTLITYFKSLGSVAVAFSGGVDSTFLIKTAQEALGEKALAVTIRSSFVPEREIREAKNFCEKEGIRQIVVEFDETQVKEFGENPPDRCYFCKKKIFRNIIDTAAKEGIHIIAEGSNLDDEGDYRPGMRAVEEMKIKSPLRELGFTKQEIRALSKEMGLPTWDKPSFACLASRFVYGEPITREKLGMVERAEQYLRNLGFHQFRVRMHGMMARIEILPEEFDKLMEDGIRKDICDYLKKLGFTYVSLDLGGYRTGSMNEALKNRE